MNSRDRLRLKIIILRLIRGHTTWFKRRSIYVGKKTDCWMLNYLPDARNPFNRLVRGLVVRKPEEGWTGDPFSLILSFPFTRFYNLHEKDAAVVDFVNAEMLEKLDGTMAAVFFPDGDPKNPQWHTRKLVSINSYDRNLTISTFNGKSFNLIEVIGRYVKNLQTARDDIPYTYVFEFIHEASQIVTQYSPDWYGLYLLAGRSIHSFNELTETELDRVAERLGCKRPRRWNAATDYPKIDALYQELGATTPNFEGFIFRDRATGNRIKVKNKDYLLRHHLLDSLSYKNLLPLILKGETEEIVAYFPHALKRIQEVKAAYEAFVKEASGTILQFQNDFRDKDRKTLALAVNARKAASIKEAFVKDSIFSCFKLLPGEVEPAVIKLYEVIALGRGKQAGQPKKALDILGLIDDNVDVEL